jgi:serine protease Do
MKFGFRFLRRAAGATVLALLMTSAWWTALPGSAAHASPDLETAQALSNAFAAAAEEVVPSVVTITSRRTIQISSRDNPFFRFFHDGRGTPFDQPQEIPQEGLGSGVIVREDGILLTNNHVVAGAEEISVLLNDGRTFDAEIVGTDPKSDLAVLRMISDGGAIQDIPAARLGGSDGLRVGDWVLAVGSPFRLSHTVTAGIVSAMGRSGFRLADYENFIQTDAAINPGNSGGAMVNLEGQVVGINTAIATRTGAYQGIGFAIPIEMARGIMESILTHGRVIRGFLGVFIQDVTRELSQAMDLRTTRGALVSEVTSGGAADEAGLEEGDLILALDRKEIENSADLRLRISSTSPGSHVALTVLRDGKTLDLDVILAELPDEDPQRVAESGAAEMDHRLGLRVTRLTGEIRESLGLDDGVHGAVVEEVDRGGPAEEAGLLPGDVIEEASRREIATPDDFWTALEEVEAGDTVLLRVIRGQQKLFVALNLPSS